STARARPPISRPWLLIVRQGTQGRAPSRHSIWGAAERWPRAPPITPSSSATSAAKPGGSGTAAAFSTALPPAPRSRQSWNDRACREQLRSGDRSAGDRALDCQNGAQMNLTLRSTSSRGDIAQVGTLAAGNLTLSTIELPWRDNLAGRSCVPAGDYELLPYLSPKHGQTWRLHNPALGVWGRTLAPEGVRTEIEIHCANFAREL